MPRARRNVRTQRLLRTSPRRGPAKPSEGPVRQRVPTHRLPALNPAMRRYVRVRLARLAGHLQTVIRMIETGADFNDVMTQLAAVRSGLTGVTAKMAEMYVTAWADTGRTDRRSLNALLNVLKFLARAY